MKKERREALEERLNEAKRIAAQGDLEDAAQVLSELAENYPDELDVQLTYAGVLFRLSRYAEAAPYFEQILRAYPTHEWASLGLFHSLWKTERRHEAIEEIRRFRDAGGESMEYRRLFKDLSKEA